MHKFNILAKHWQFTRIHSICMSSIATEMHKFSRKEISISKMWVVLKQVQQIFEFQNNPPFKATKQQQATKGSCFIVIFLIVFFFFFLLVFFIFCFNILYSYIFIVFIQHKSLSLMCPVIGVAFIAATDALVLFAKFSQAHTCTCTHTYTLTNS